MKLITVLISMIFLSLVSCKKSDPCNTPTSLDGKWRMVLVTDNISGATSTKPSSISGNVDISFSTSGAAGGTFVGVTPSNTIDPNNFVAGPAFALTIENLSMTKIAETTWGNQFVNHIRSSQKYSFENCDGLNIITTEKTLSFQKQ